MFIFHFPISMLLEWYERPGRIKYKAVKWQVTARSKGSGRNLVLSISLPFMCIAKQLVQTNRQSSAGASSCTPLPFHTDTQMHLQPPPPQPMKLPALLLQNVWEVQTADRISTARDTSRWGLLRERVRMCVCMSAATTDQRKMTEAYPGQSLHADLLCTQSHKKAQRHLRSILSNIYITFFAYDIVVFLAFTTFNVIHCA